MAKKRQGRGKMLNPEARQFFPQADRWESAIPYIKAIMRSILYSSENKLDNVLVPLTVKVPKYYRDKFHILKMDAGFTNLEKFIVAILVTYANSKGANLPKTLDFPDA